MHRVLLSAVLSLSVLLSLLGLARPVPAAEFACAAGDVACLISAINGANANGAVNTITLPAGLYPLTTVDNDADGPTGLPSITSTLTLRGSGAQSTVIERAAGAPPFRLLHVAALGVLTLEGLTLRGGDATTTNAGGGIWNQGTLTLTRSTMSDNVANNGGGIASAGPLTITNSTLSGNVANSGGGISVSAGSSPLTITNSTLHGNWANGSGGGISSLVVFGMTITNSTLSGNVANSGGGIGLSVSTLTLTNSTVTGNTASQGGGISIAGGGFLAPASRAILGNTILAQNTVPPTGTGPDCVTSSGGPRGPGQATSQGHNLIGNPTGCNISLATSDLTGDPGLGAFTDDGTPGQGYLPLLPTSRAIDAGDPAACPATDQLGQSRVGPCDIGAIEFQPPDLQAPWVLIPGGGFTPSAPAATSYQDNLALFVRGTDDQLYVNWLLPTDQWTGWSLVPGSGFTPSAPAATSYQDNLALFVRGTDDQLYVNWLLPTDQWTGWSLVPGSGFTPSAPASTVLNGNLALFARGDDGQLYVNWLLPNYQWVGWGLVGGSSPSTPAGTVFQGNLALFARGGDSHLYVNFSLTGP